MKKMIKLTAIAMAMVMMFPNAAMASRKINDSAPIDLSESVRIEKTINNNATVYTANANTKAEKEAAFEMIRALSGDPMAFGKNGNAGDLNGDVYEPNAPLAPGQSEYHNDERWHGSAYSYSWKRNTASTWANNFEGGQSTLWNGNGNCSYIILSESINVNGIAVSVSWPPAISGSSSSGSWTSQPIYSNVAGSSFTGLTVGWSATSVTFSDGGDVYVGNSIYRPYTYIKFSFFS